MELVTGALPGPEEMKDAQAAEAQEEKVKKPRGRAAVRIRMETLEGEVADRIREYVAVPLGMVSPLGMAVLDIRADRTAKALCRIAATSPGMRRALERFVQGSAAVDVTGTLIAVTIAVGVDLHRIEPASMPARFAGIPLAWERAYGNEPYWQFSQNGHTEPDDMRGSFLGDIE